MKISSFAKTTIARKKNNVSVFCVFKLKLKSIIHSINRFECVDKQVFKDLDFLGWYTTGSRPTDQDVKVHKQICEINECPIMLQLSPQSRNFDVSQCLLDYWIY